MPIYKVLFAQAKKKEIILENAIPTDKARYNLLQLLYIYQDVRVAQLKDILPTNLITHQIQLQEDIKIHIARYKKLLQNCKWWLKRIVEKSMDTEIYENTVITNSFASKRNANLVIISKPGQMQSQFMFNYHFTYKDISASHMEAMANMRN